MEQNNDGQMHLQAAPKRDSRTAPREEASDSENSAGSELGRAFGDSTRTYLEGMAPAKKIEIAKRMKMREKRRGKRS